MKEQYQMIRKLAENERNLVYLVRDTAVGKCRVMKVSKQNGEEAEQELHILQRISHRGIAALIDYRKEESGGSLILEYAEGVSLKQLIREQGRIDARQAVRWAAELADILDYLHRLPEPVYYLDLKPEHIIVCPDGHIRLIDFDAAVLGGENLTGQQERRAYRMGTYGYAAPEQCSGEKGTKVGAWTDMYGLGMTLYTMTTGLNPADPPYGLRPENQWVPMVDGRLAELILHCTRQETGKRCPGAQTLLRELEAVEERLQDREEKRNSSGESKSWKLKRRKKTLVQKKSLFLSDRNYARIWAAGLLAGAVLSSSLTGYAAAETAEPLLVVLKDERQRNILLQDEALFELEGDLKLEIPKEYLYPKNKILIRVQEESGAGKRIRELRIEVKEDGTQAYVPDQESP